MKKTIIALSLVLSGLFATSAVAQTPAAACPVEQTCQRSDSCRQQRPCPFDGLNLTEQQKAQLKEIQPCGKGPKCEAAKGECRQQKREAAKTARKEYLAKVKAILTPEQYVQFLENTYVNRPAVKGHGQKAPRIKGHHARKATRQGGMQQRANGQLQQARPQSAQ